ncbi:MAG: Gfo/Idh/MocA family oxidoreductase [Planctomycetes bacterium]|nr:Gfo/Idh/MocA family oxidoreductase [Planctomycetota bacterium]
MKSVTNLGLMCTASDLPSAIPLLTEAGFQVRAVFSPGEPSLNDLPINPEANATHFCTSYPMLLEYSGLVALAIFSPPQNFDELICAALEAGKHVICEFPKTPTVEACERVLHAHRKSGRTVVFLPCRSGVHECTALAHHYLTSGKLGRLYHAESIHTTTATWPVNQHTRPEEIGTSLIHQTIDLLQYPKIHSLSAYVHSDTENSYGHTSLFARVAGDISVSIEYAANPSLKPHHSFTILGDRGGLLVDYTEGGRGFSFVEVAPGPAAKLLETKPLFKPEFRPSSYRAFHAHVSLGDPHAGITPEQLLEVALWRQAVRTAVLEGRELTWAG